MAGEDLKTFEGGIDKFTEHLNKLVDAINDHRQRIEQLEAGGGSEIQVQVVQDTELKTLSVTGRIVASV